jgi:hypothetical protein
VRDDHDAIARGRELGVRGTDAGGRAEKIAGHAADAPRN